jgi:nucleoside-diphosphate-sugar epimerase
MKILITGSCGFIGSNYINSLLNDKRIDKIIGIDNLSHGTFLKGVHDHPKVDQYIFDVRDKDVITPLFENIDYVLHLAGMVSIYDCDKDPYGTMDNNIMGAINVLEACLKHKIKKIIAPETSAVYEDCGNGPYAESQMNPTTIYATSKAMVGLMFKSYQKTRRLTYTLLRFFNVYGELQDWKRTVPPASAGFGIRLMQGKKPIIFGNAERRRDFIHVNDVINFLNMCLYDKRTNNETYNIGTGKSRSLIEMMQEIAKVLNVPYEGYIQMPEINGEAFEIFADISKAKILDWEPQVTFEEGHASLIRYLKTLYDQKIFPEDFMDNINISEIKI